MRAIDLRTPLPVVDRNTTALDAAHLVATGGLPGLVVADPSGKPVAVLSSVDVLGLLVPNYVMEDMSLAGVFDEQAAEEVWAHVGERTLAELLDDDGVRVHDILKVDADASLVEIAAQMVDAHAQIALLKEPAGTEPGFILLPAVMQAILRYCGPGAQDLTS